jgi:ADP-ribosylation factor-like protein 2
MVKILKKFLQQCTNFQLIQSGFNINTFSFQDKIINFWDIGGQKSLRTFWRNYFEETGLKYI